MTGTSTIPAAIDALVSLISAALPDVQVLDGPPVGTALNFDHVIVGGDSEQPSAEGDQAPAQIGNQRRHEGYRVPVQCGSYAAGTQKAVRDRAFTIAAAVETVLRENPRLADPDGAPVVRLAQVAGGIRLDQEPPTHTNDAGEEVVSGRKAVVTVTVDCVARI